MEPKFSDRRRHGCACVGLDRQHADEIEEAIAKERERCAQVCIQLASMHRGTTAEAMREAAILIRRGPELDGIVGSPTEGRPLTGTEVPERKL